MTTAAVQFVELIRQAHASLPAAQPVRERLRWCAACEAYTPQTVAWVAGRRVSTCRCGCSAVEK